MWVREERTVGREIFGEVPERTEDPERIFCIFYREIFFILLRIELPLFKIEIALIVSEVWR